MEALLRNSVHPSPEPSRPCSMAYWSRRRAIRESADAFAGDLHDVRNPGRHRAVDDRELLLGDGQADEHHWRDALHRRSTLAQSVRSLLDHVDARRGQRRVGTRAITRTSCPARPGAGQSSQAWTCRPPT